VKPDNKRMHLTVGRPAAANVGFRSRPPAGDAPPLATMCALVKTAFSMTVRALGVLLLFCTVGLGWLMWNFNRPPFDLQRLEQLRVGMSQEETRQILGPPTSGDSNSWAYSRPMAWPIVYVRFDESGGFQESEYDY
jgi:hypothetical protein